MMNYLIKTSLFVILILNCSCGNFFKPSNSEIAFDSKPPGSDQKVKDSSNTYKPNDQYFGLSESQFLDKLEMNNSSNWNILPKKGKSYLNVKLIKLEKDLLFFDEMAKIEYDEYFDVTNQHVIANRQIPLDSINWIVYKKEITGSEILGNVFKGLLIGTAIGFGSIYVLFGKQKGEGAIVPFLFGCGTSLLGAIVGLIFSTDDYEAFDLRKLSLNEKINLINREILLKE